jgi:hypothetical protein
MPGSHATRHSRCSQVCSVCDSLSLIRTDGRGECRDSRSQGRVISGPRNEQFSSASAPPGGGKREYEHRHHRECLNP